jgi:LacI family transcriptional regulator
MSAAEEMGYHPNLGARSLRAGGEGCMGLTIPAPIESVPISREFFIYLCGELYRIFGSQGERICLDLNPRASGDSDYARSIWQKVFSACVVAGPLLIDDKIIRRVHESGVPYLTLGRLDSLPECNCATVDYDQGTYDCVKRLIERGHKRIGLLKTLAGYQPGVERRRGYLRALEEAGLETEDRLIQPVSFNWGNLKSATYRLLNDHRVTAIVDASGLEDGTAIREAACRANRTPGGDFDVICWTYSTDSPVLEEACAHLLLPVREAASEGLELLAEWYWGRRSEPVHVVYSAKLVDADAFAKTAQFRRRKHLFVP